MKREEILQKTNTVFIDILDDETIQLNSETTADDIEDWNSLTHIELIVAVEKAFDIRFTSFEIQNWNNVGEMIDSIQKKI